MILGGFFGERSLRGGNGIIVGTEIGSDGLYGGLTVFGGVDSLIFDLLDLLVVGNFLARISFVRSSI